MPRSCRTQTVSEYLENLRVEDRISLPYGDQREAALIAYLAGIIDGEGTIRINKTSSPKALKQTNRASLWYSAMIAVGMVDRRIPCLLQAAFGGSVREERVPGRRSIWRWAITSRPMCLEVARVLLPYLIVKRKQAELLIEFCADWRDGRVNGGHAPTPVEELQRREFLYQGMRKLNAVGAPATTERDGTREGEATV